MTLSVQLLPLLFGPAAMLLSQATPPELNPNFVQLASNGAIAAVLAWYVIYDVRVRTPAMLTAFAKEQSETREIFRTEQAETRVNHLQAQTEMRMAFNSEQNEARKQFAVELTAMRTQYDRELGELRGMLFKNIESMRGAVHDVRDTAQQLMLTQAGTKGGT